ncbi:translation peptide chain release factor 2 [Komagataeibacter oboediens DSM 11826]|nr:translation peptide chain release factor 2 [Komagataeibacter oboediens DSM 11826]
MWNDSEAAQKLMRERTLLASQIEGVQRLEADVNDTLELVELAEMEGDSAVVAEALASLRALAEEAKRRETESLLSGEADSNDCYLEVNAGAGGTEAQDWAEMLLRMYTRWAEQHGYKVTMLESSEGEQAGIKSATIQVSGPNAYGWLKTEAGVHRLVRISPFDAAARRQTSFASVWVYPVVDDSIEIEINEADLRVDTFRASGAGGQHVNKTESAIRITHIPTGIVVACQTDRSQHRNRATAMTMLKARMYEQELQKREAAAAQTEANKTDIGWGHQIRSYVLAPYQLVKDLRTNVEKTNPDAILDGDLDDFMAAALAARVGATRSEASAQAQ